MSRIGKLPIALPDKVEVKVNGGDVVVKGPKGELRRPLPPMVSFKVEGSELTIERSSERQGAGAMHGLSRSLIANMITGVSAGFTKVLQITGVGYKVDKVGKGYLRFDLGYSHPIFFELPAGLVAEVGRGNVLTLSSIDKEVLGQAAATIRSLRPPEPYKGKGIRYSDEVIQRKVGKAAGK